MSGSSVPLLPLVSSLALLLAPGARGADEAAPRVVRDAVTDRYVPAPLSGQERRVRVPAYGYRFLRLNDGRGAA